LCTVEGGNIKTMHIIFFPQLSLQSRLSKLPSSKDAVAPAMKIIPTSCPRDLELNEGPSSYRPKEMD
jgi:hypothetical protein